jgi:hypothetical protein
LAQFVENAPVASDFMETARSFGNYDLALSLADLLDNSISAGASKINISVLFDGAFSSLKILDNGEGMWPQELQEAMRMASQNPKNVRSKNDLGRFGLGLKTASFAQASCLTVCTRKGGVLSGAEWDLDDIENWKMKIFDEFEISQKINALNTSDTFTLVIWSKLSRLLENFSVSEDEFYQLIVDACDQLSLIYHRYLSGEVPFLTEKLEITINGRLLEPQDPFLTNHPATQKLHQEEEKIGSSSIKITPYILPHFSKLRGDDSERLAGKEGYLRNQGFYVYRNYRLIIKGTWFKIIPHGELTKLARVMVDIPNSIDEEWKITVDKSEAQIPAMVRKRLKQLTEKISQGSNKVYTKKGVRLNKTEVVSIWNEVRQKGSTRFKLNRSHPFIQALLNEKFDFDRSKLNNVISLIEDGLPINDIHRALSDNPEKVQQQFTEIEPIVELARIFINDEKARGANTDEIKMQLLKVYPFNQFYEGLLDVFEREELLID